MTRSVIKIQDDEKEIAMRRFLYTIGSMFLFRKLFGGRRTAGYGRRGF